MWATGEPHANGYGCTGINGEGKLFDRTCVHEFNFLCMFGSALERKTGKELFQTCPADWKLHNSWCYLPSSDKRDWPSAKAQCNTVGTRLAVIRDPDWFSANSMFADSFWIGGLQHSEADEPANGWHWLDRSPIDRSPGNNWKAGEPNDYGGTSEDILAMNQWNDLPCSFEIKYACEIKSL